MATSSSDGSCTAPADFQLSSELEDGSSRLSVNLLKCPLCCSNRKIYHCRQCIQNGDFTHSTSAYPERLSEKQLRYIRIKNAKTQIEEKITKYLENKLVKETLTHDIKSCRERLDVIQKFINEKKESIAQKNKELRKIKRQNQVKVDKLSKCDERLDRMEKQLKERTENVKEGKAVVEDIKEEMILYVKLNARQTLQYIFIIKELEMLSARYGIEPRVEVDNVTTAIADASGTMYVRGEWINDNVERREVIHQIVVPTLRADGDYSAYRRWAMSSTDGVLPALINRERTLLNPAFNITAALTYVTQIVNVLSAYLRVKLPYNLCHSEFCGNDLTDVKFNRRVAKLNVNVLHLLYIHNVDVLTVNPRHTVRNILLVLASDFGRTGPIRIDTYITESLNNCFIPELEACDDEVHTPDEEEDESNWDWESVPNVSCPEMTLPNPGYLSNQMSSQVNQSVAGNLMNSAAAGIASIWRVWANNR